VIFTVPAATPVTTPLPVTVAVAVLLLLHVPPETASLSVVVEPTHVNIVPVIAVAGPETVIVAVLAQPVDSVYAIVVVPSVRPETTPPAEMEPTVLSLLLHVPPLVASESAVVEP
jgi:hypothetical protein